MTCSALTASGTSRRLAWLLFGLLLAAPSVAGAQAERAARVSLGVVYEESGQGSVAALRRVMQAEIERDDLLILVSHQPFIQAAQRARRPAARWLEPDSLRQFTLGMEIDILLALRLRREGNRYRAILEAFDPRTGDRLALHSLQLTQPRLQAPRAGELLDGVFRELRAGQEQEEEPPTPPIEDEPDVARDHEEEADTFEDFDDDWAAELDFGDLNIETSIVESTVELGGRVRVEHYRFFKDIEGEDDASLGRDSLDLLLEAKAAAQNIYCVGRLLIRRDLTEPWRNRIEPDEAFVDIQSSKAALRAGSFIATWGSANLFNPTDILNYRDTRDPLDPEKRPTWMARLSLNMGMARLEAYYLPVPQVNTLAMPPLFGGSHDDARWRFEIPLEEPPIPTQFTVNPDVPPSARPENSQGAVRLAWPAFGADFSISYLTLIDRLPVTRTSVMVLPTTPIPTAVAALDFDYPRLHAAGLDFEYARGNVRIAAEALGILPGKLGETSLERDREEDDPPVEVEVHGYTEEPHVIAVLGIDFRTRRFLDSHRLHFFLDVVVTEAISGELPDSSLDRIRYPLRRAVIGRVAYHAGTRLTLEVNAIQSLDIRDGLIMPSIDYDLFERASLRIGAQIPHGKSEEGEPEGPFGRYSQNSRFMAVLEAKF